MSAILEQLERDLELQGLDLLGGFNPTAADGAPAKCQTLLLLGPSESFWNTLTASKEYSDGLPDPIDRWSTRVIGTIAESFKGTAVFPFGPPPYAPFYSWAMKTGRIWSSPLKLAVHDKHGLFVSFRGAICLPDLIEVRGGESPCETCPRPCETACPVGALSPKEYDVAACKSFLSAPAGDECMSMGCAARRACPVGQTLRSHAQSAYHMSMFHQR